LYRYTWGLLKSQLMVDPSSMDQETAARAAVGTCPKFYAKMLAKVPKRPPKYPKAHAQMLVKVPKMSPRFPK
jgi:hypothetical protein